MTVKQVGKYLQIDKHTVYKLARSCELPSVKISGQWRFKKSVIDRWLEENSVRNLNSHKNKE